MLYAIMTAAWLDKTFYGFDEGILRFYHNLGELTDYHINGFFKFISALAEYGLGMIILAALMAFVPLIPKLYLKNPERAKKICICGLSAGLAMAFGLLFTNMCIKNVVARIRPYEAYDTFRQWWSLAGGYPDAEFSFPSGHTTCTMAIMTSIFIYGRKKYSWTAFFMVILMGMSRNYLMMHYPTDIMGGMVVGGVAAILASLVWKFLSPGFFALYERLYKKKDA